MASQNAIGKVETVAGTVGVTHADGTTGTLGPGDPVFQGDQLRTEMGGAVGMKFEDGTTFSLGEKGRMTLDEMVYDPASKAGSASLSIDKGAFTLVSGDISKTTPDALTVKTPTMTIGVRGTALTSNGQTVALMAEQGQKVGELSVKGASGQTITLNQAGQAASLSPSGSLTPTSMTPNQVAQLGGNSLAALPGGHQSVLGAAFSGAISQSQAAFAAQQAAAPPPKAPEPQKSPSVEKIQQQQAEKAAKEAGKAETVLEVLKQLHQETEQKIEQIKQAVELARHEVEAKQEEAKRAADRAAADVAPQVHQLFQDFTALDNAAAARAMQLRDQAQAALTALKAQEDLVEGKVALMGPKLVVLASPTATGSDQTAAKSALSTPYADAIAAQSQVDSYVASISGLAAQAVAAAAGHGGLATQYALAAQSALTEAQALQAAVKTTMTLVTKMAADPATFFTTVGQWSTHNATNDPTTAVDDTTISLAEHDAL
ncbi:MAG: FecR domain-containing protein, partial [Actinomycetota bacterium]